LEVLPNRLPGVDETPVAPIDEFNGIDGVLLKLKSDLFCIVLLAVVEPVVNSDGCELENRFEEGFELNRVLALDPKGATEVLGLPNIGFGARLLFCAFVAPKREVCVGAVGPPNSGLTGAVELAEPEKNELLRVGLDVETEPNIEVVGA
jgi:hypothetical protein